MSAILPAVVIAAVMAGAWGLSVAISDVSIVDPLWGLTFAAVSLACGIGDHGTPGRRWLICGVTALWGLRLGLHLARRKRAEPGEDRRYQALRAKHPDDFWIRSLVSVFLLQGVLIGVVALPVEFAATRATPLNLLELPGLALFLIGLGFEACGDEQLRRFKADPANRGRVMDRGLWRYTRHPNYFGDACVWWGIWLLALPTGAWWTLVGPVIVTILLTRVSGKALLERDIAGRRPEYADYVKRTSGFFPLPPRGSSR